MRLTRDQIELRDTLRSFLSERVSSDYLRRRIESGERRDPDFARSLDEMGIVDGFSGETPLFSSVELGIVAHEAGRALLPEPIVDQVIARFLFPRYASSETRTAIGALPPTAVIVVAPRQACRLSPGTGEGAFTGSIAWCRGPIDATHLLAFVEDRGAGPDEGRVVLVELLPKWATVTPCTSIDLTTPLISVHLNESPGRAIGAEDLALLESLFESLKACEVAGVAAKAIEMTVEYVKTREQFGVPIGGFQAIQQQLASAYAKSQALDALARFSSWSAAASPDQFKLTARAAALYAAEHGPGICETAIQCHGGIGFTWEYDLHLYLRRAKLLQSVLACNDARARELLDSVDNA